MKMVLILFLVLHGLIHLMGFLKAWHLAALPQLSGRLLIPLSEPGVRVVGALWLLAGTSFLVAALLRLARPEWWWAAALCGAVLSQVLIFLQWQDAWAGSLANGLLIVTALSALATGRFEHQSRGLALDLLHHGKMDTNLVSAAQVATLPAPVQRWLRGAGVIGRARVSTIRLKQRGLLRAAPTGAWMPVAAEQYFTVDEPAFLWSARVTMAGVLPLVGRDRYQRGAGHMLIKAVGLYAVADAGGDKINQGSLLRYLGETVWFPSAALSPAITWAALDESRARATLRHGGRSVSADFTFDERGRFTRLSAERYLGGGEDAQLERWEITASQWRTFEGVEVPAAGEVVWRLASGDFPCYRWELTDLAYDRPGLYPR